MPSRAETRRLVEHGLRGALVSLLVLAAWRAFRSDARADGPAGISVSTFDRDIRALLATNRADAVVLTVDATPDRSQRDAARALSRAGLDVAWHGNIPALAIEVDRDRDPFADGHLAVVADTGAPLAILDSAGALDSIRARAATLDVGTMVGSVRGVRGRFAAVSAVPPAEGRRAVLVLGRVSWEVKFVAAALGESGWMVRSSSTAAPTVTVRDDAIVPIDTARYDAVIALDSTAADFAPAIVKFVAQGGGLIALGSGMDLRDLQDLAPAVAGERRPGRILLSDDTVTTRDLPSRALTNVRADAVTLGKEPQGVVLAARRAGMGRVLAVGYDETWRWRMLGGESGLSLHRDWWSHAVAAVAPARSDSLAPGTGDAAPRAAIVDALGPPSATSAAPLERRTDALPWMMLILIALLLLAETGSRRLRGAA